MGGWNSAWATGWFEAEHTAYGIPFPPLGERFDRLEEQLEIITGLWGTGGPDVLVQGHVLPAGGLARAAQAGAAAQTPADHRRGRQAPDAAARREIRRRVQRPLRAALEETGAAYGRVRDACAAAGRHESSMINSAAHVVCCGRSKAEMDRRAAVIGRGARPGEGLVGTPDEIAEMIGQFAEIGAEHIYLQVLDLSDLDHLELLAAEVLPQV